MNKKTGLTEAEAKALLAVVGGADVYHPGLARALRLLEERDPTLVEVCKPMNASSDSREAYCGAFTEVKGKEKARQTLGSRASLEWSKRMANKHPTIVNAALDAVFPDYKPKVLIYTSGGVIQFISADRSIDIVVADQDEKKAGEIGYGRHLPEVIKPDLDLEAEAKAILN
jgi:hypothetical protein